MHIGVIGVGGIGGYYGARLQQDGHDVTFVARGAQLTALREYGLRVRHPEFQFSAPVDAIDMAQLCRCDPISFDVLLIATKASATADIARTLAQWYERSAGQAPVMSLQNGVDNEAVLASALGDRMIIGGLSVRIGTHIAAPGHIEASGAGQITTGVWPDSEHAADGPAKDCLARVAPALAAAGIPVEETDDIRRELWRKLVINNGVNPLSALTRRDSRALTHEPCLAPLVKRLMHETAAAARADGVMLDDRDIDDMFAVIHNLDAIKTSMLIDYENGRSLELDAICGAVLERTKRLGAEAPGTEMVAALLGVESGQHQPTS